MYDNGNANFNDSAGARNVTAALNPLTPGGTSPKGVHMPTLTWVVVFGVLAFAIYHFVLRKGRR